MSVEINDKVAVIVAGMPRSGTTSLYHLFDIHPGFFVPFRKETAYFSYNYHKGAEWYKDLYADKERFEMGMDISPQYFIDRNALLRIKKCLPKAKIILSVRDPIEWVKSNYHQINKFEKLPNIQRYVEGYSIRTEKGSITYRLGQGYIRNTIELAMELFGENLLMFQFEYFRAYPLSVLSEIEKFCGVDPYFNETNLSFVKVNSSDQLNFRPLTWLLSRERFITAVDFFFPRKFIKNSRKVFDLVTSRRKSLEKNKIFTPQDDRFIEQAFLQDKVWIDNLFKSNRFIQKRAN